MLWRGPASLHGVEQQREQDPRQLEALALHCSAGWPTSSGNGFASALNTAVAVLVPCIHHHGLFLKQQQQQCSSSSGCCSGLSSAGGGCWMLEVLEAAVL